MTFQRTQLLNFPVSAGPCLSLLYTPPPPQESVLLAYIFCLTSHDWSLTYRAKFSVRTLLFYEIIYFILFHVFCKKCIAAIACAEIPNRQWLEVVDILQNIAVQPTSADSLREQALEAIGYLCQDIVSTLLTVSPLNPPCCKCRYPSKEID